MITISPMATTKLKELLSEEGSSDSSLRIIAIPSGEGVQYTLALEDNPQKDDTLLEHDGVPIVVDSDSEPLLEGSEIDYVETLMRSGFTISNANFPAGGGCGSGGCGCGSGGSGGCGCGSGGCGGH
jgi:iron-sulfur cluster assembly protein